MGKITSRDGKSEFEAETIPVLGSELYDAAVRALSDDSSPQRALDVVVTILDVAARVWRGVRWKQGGALHRPSMRQFLDLAVHVANAITEDNKKPKG